MSQDQFDSENNFTVIDSDDDDDNDDEGGTMGNVEVREPVVCEKMTKSDTSSTYTWCNKLLLQPKELFTEGKAAGR